MARQPEIRYIRYYTDGSVARQQERPQPAGHKTTLPKVRKQKKQIIYVDPLAWTGIALSVVMLVLMVVGSLQLYQLQQENARLQSYVYSLENENLALNDTYRSDLNLDEIRDFALSLGMIPQEEAQTITIHVPREAAQPAQMEQTGWDAFAAFLAGLFA